ncbi:MAG TPA: serine hydrolase [Dissulfurispiraceae bacterium]|nr:serine hydrolase [Dissulfurispiraceae bacterium]
MVNIHRVIIRQLQKYAIVFLAFSPVLLAVWCCADASVPDVKESQLAPIADMVDQAIKNRKTPGAVVVIGNKSGVYYSRAFGYQSVEPAKVAMTEDTIFDIASLTKVVATSTAVMQLVEKKKIRLDDPVAKYWPAFRKNGKSLITVRQLMTHYSGLRPDLRDAYSWKGYSTALKKIIAERPQCQPGSCYEYSDINFEILGELVQRIAGQRLDKYCRRNIFDPLGMRDTGFGTSASALIRTAPTEHRQGKLICGEAHDPTCYAMGGISGHAGLFSTATDLSLFARMMLNGGTLGKARILRADTVEQMTLPQSPRGKSRLRGLGWDIEPPFASNAGELSPVGAYGHLGYTGTALWIDPITQTFIIVLTNRVHPAGQGDVKDLRAGIKALVSANLGPIAPATILDKRPSLATFFISKGSSSSEVDNSSRILTGIDILRRDKFVLLAGKTIGLITNHTGVDSTGRRTVDLLSSAPGVKLKAIFSPEHGIDGTIDAKVASSRDGKTGLPVYSLYGVTLRPTDLMLEGIEALVFDIQDIGVRFYTYISTMGYAMESAAKKNIPIYVLDRPDPITASVVQGPVSDSIAAKSFTSYFLMPVRYGMTAGELAQMFNAEYRIGADLHVIKMSGYRREQWYDETGLKWINPSPNIRSLLEATLYPGVALIEGANVSVGRGTATPFELLGAPWIDAGKLASYLNARAIAGVKFEEAEFTPISSNFKKRRCYGVRIVLIDRLLFDPVYMGVEIMSALHRLYPKDFDLNDTLGLVGSRSVLDDMRRGHDPKSIALSWQSQLEKFRQTRAKYLLY